LGASRLLGCETLFAGGIHADYRDWAGSRRRRAGSTLEPTPPGTLFAAEADARDAAGHLIRDAGFEPIHLGDLAQAPLLESLIALTSTLDRGELGPFFYRFHRPGELAERLGLNQT
jgi:hypothetical protein